MKKFFFLLALLTGAATASDPMFSEQWGLKNSGQIIFRDESDIRQEQSRGIPGLDVDWPGLEYFSSDAPARDVIVAVIDSGIDEGHPEFQGRLVPGRDFLRLNSVNDDTGHGTHIAGIIAANADGAGVVGMTPARVKLMPLKVLSRRTNSFVHCLDEDAQPNRPCRTNRLITDIFADAIIHAIEAKVDVINLSLGWPQIINTPRVLRALDVAHERGIVVVAAAGNTNKDLPTWPCSHRTVICVGAVDNQGKLTTFTNHGGKVDLVAPGEWIVSTAPRSDESRALRRKNYEVKSGSSQAAPFVAAAAALLRLKNPEMSVAEIKARLYATARPLGKDVDQRFVRFGLLQVKKAIEADSPKLASVLVKDLVTVPLSETGEFNFTLQIEKLLATDEPSVELEGLSADLSIEGDRVRIRGQLSDLTQDSDVTVSFITRAHGQEARSQINLAFARNLRRQDLTNLELPGVTAGDVLTIQGFYKEAHLGQVSVEGTPTSDIHAYLIPQRANAEARQQRNMVVQTIRANAADARVKLSTVHLQDYGGVFAVFEKDVNFDGKSDLIVYGRNFANRALVLSFFDLEGKPLFGEHSRWELPITTFEGLPMSNRDNQLGNFSWLKLRTFLGEIQVPYYQKTWLLPEQDNSTRLVDREPNGPASRLYYLEPQLVDGKVRLRPRVVDSVSFKKNLRRSLNAGARELVTVDYILPQTSAERERGSARHLVSVGEGIRRRYSILEVSSPAEHRLLPHADQDGFQSGNHQLVTRRTEDNSVSENSFLLALFDRFNFRAKPVTGGVEAPWELRTSGWRNPIAEIVGSFEGSDRRVLMFESRHHVYVYDQLGRSTPNVHRLPINRDTSFSAMSFSETLQPVLVKESGVNQPSLSVDSTFIYGDRLYSMVAAPQGFHRPVGLSVIIPQNCVPFKPQYLRQQQHSAYTVLCRQPDGGVTLGLFPLEIN
jgi:hypothetical protein